MRGIPAQTSEIFEKLRKGEFISSNSVADSSAKELYPIIDEYFDPLKEYFCHINFILEKEDEYFYFSRHEPKASLEDKLAAVGRWIDILDFFKAYDPSFGSGYRFSPSEILASVKTDAGLKDKLSGLGKHTEKKEVYSEILQKILDILKKETFIELENHITANYKVLASFKYIERLVSSITISDQKINEIPE